MKVNKKQIVTLLFASFILISCGKGKQSSSSDSFFSSSSEESSLFSSSESSEETSSEEVSSQELSSEEVSSEELSSEELSSLEDSSEEQSSEEISSEELPSEESSSKELSSEESSEDSSEESSSEEIKDDFILDTAPFYLPKYSNGDYVTSLAATFDYGYFEDNTCFVYMPIDTALSFLFPEQYSEDISIHFYSYETLSGLKISVYPETDIISFVNFDETNLFSKENDSVLGMIDEKTTTDYVDCSNSEYIGEGNVTFDLSEYSLQIVERNNRAYLPFSIINNIFFVSKYYSAVGFNGTGFYLLDMLNGVCGLDGGTNNTFMNAYYHGSFRGKSRNAKFVEDNYNALMFQFDHFYGFHDERMAPFGTYLSENYPEIVTDLKNSSHSVYSRAINRILDEVIGDGHTNSGRASTPFGTGTISGTNYSSDRSRALDQAYYECYSARYSASLPSSIVRYKNNTAIISFDIFYHEGTTFTSSNIDYYRNSDTFAMFHYAFGEINKRTDIQNIIFDITCNGGGDTNALIPMLGFLSDKVEMTVYNPLSKLVGNLSYKVDTNLDGSYDEKDNYKDKYNYFVLTSNYSFSCANLFAMVCKNSGLATIIGKQSGGGACVVSYTATPDGKPFRISGNMRNGFKDNPTNHDDYGVPVDYEIEVRNFYNDTYLDNFVNNL